MTKDTIWYAIALTVLIGCGAAIVLVYDVPEAPGRIEAPVPPCDVLVDGGNRVVDDETFAGCGQRWPHLLELCADDVDRPLMLLLTPDTRWALRVGEAPLRVSADNDVRLASAWCAR